VVASAVGAGARMGGAAVYIAGSTDCVAVVVPRPAADSAWVNCAYVPRETWLSIGTTTSSGASVEWFAREVLASDDLALMTELASSSPPGSNRLLYVPYLQGERTPVWDSQARGLFIGLTASITQGDLARAVFEGTAFALRQVVECTESEITEIRAVGGGTRNALWNQIRADVLKIPLHVLRFQETGALGAALMAGAGAGVYDSFEGAAYATAGIAAAKIEPDPARAGLYDELFALYSRLYPQTKDVMHRLANEQSATKPA
jgi:xylulokinase